MAKKNFTEEEMKLLKASPYVLKVRPSLVQFSIEFKEKFWKDLLAGQNPQEIVRDLGIDPEILGENRISGLKRMISNEATDGKGFRDIESSNIYMNGYMSDEDKIKYLEQQIAYKEQEIEFL